MDEILFLCTGNTCRSPMAEGMFRALHGEEKTGLHAASVEAAAEFGADIHAHASRMLTAEMAQNAKYLVCMTGAHYDRVLEMFPQVEDKLFTLSELDISDPFGGDLETYRRCAAQIQKAVAHIIERLKK